MTERSQRAGGFKLVTSCFDRRLIGGHCCRAGSSELISNVEQEKMDPDESAMRGTSCWLLARAWVF